jgi:hypothetical protein
VVSVLLIQSSGDFVHPTRLKPSIIHMVRVLLSVHPVSTRHGNWVHDPFAEIARPLLALVQFSCYSALFRSDFVPSFRVLPAIFDLLAVREARCPGA